MSRLLLAGLLAIGVLGSGSIFLIAWSTSPEQPRATATEPVAIQGKMMGRRQASAAARSVAVSPVPVPSASPVAQAAPRFARANAPPRSGPRRYDSRRPPAEKPIRTRVVTSARDRYLSVAHPEILAEARSAAAASAMTLEDPAPQNAPCVPGVGCDQAQDINGNAEVVPLEDVAGHPDAPTLDTLTGDAAAPVP